MKYQAKKILPLSVAVAVGCLSGSVTVHAAQALEEIMVTAQRKVENVQEVPISISAFSADSLEKAGIDRPEDLSLVIPSMKISRGVTGTTVFLRGVGSISGYLPGFENSVATYVDGVYIDGSRGNIFSFNNIERVEVLKGPQGTLFGRNATGGLIHVITKEPDQEAGGSLEVSYGDFDAIGGKLYVTGGLSDTVAADLAVLYADQGEGYGENIFDGSDVLRREELSLRASLLWDISDNTRARLSLDYSDWEDDFGVSRQHVDDGTLHFGGFPYTGNFYNVNTDTPVLNTNEAWGASINIKHSWGDYELTSVTAYRDSEGALLLDQDATPLLLVDFSSGVNSDFFSQEFRLLSTGDSDFEWIAGVYYMESMGEFNPYSLFGGLFAAAPFDGFVGSGTQETESFSAFYQGTYHLSDATSLTAGVRWTRDERELTETGTLHFGGGVLVPLPAVAADESWEEPTWRLSVDHHLNDDTLLYASYSRGFKSGVYATSTALSDVPAGMVSDPVNPETLDAFEIGFKSDLANGSLRLNGSVFYYDYQNLQFERVEAGVAILWNAGEAEVKGAELEFNWLPTDNLAFRGGLSIIDAEYTEFADAPITQPNPNPPYGNIQVIDTNGALTIGNSLIRTSDYTFNLGAVYTVPTDMGEFAAAMQYSYNDGFPWDVDNRLQQDSYDLVNAELSLAGNDESWRVRLYAKNLLDEEYAAYGVSSGLGDSFSPAPPRTWGVALQFSF